jgi:shikimate dehydrogenase
LDDEAQSIGAVNTVKIIRSNGNILLKGYNTDAFGFKQSLISLLSSKRHKALILGTGGAAKAVEWVLKSLCIDYCFVSRNPKRPQDYSYQQLSPQIISDTKLIINTSPIGMFPNVDKAPELPYDAISPEHLLYDLIYNPEQTLFLKYGEQKKATTINGLPMLYFQAEKAWEIWNTD